MPSFEPPPAGHGGNGAGLGGGPGPGGPGDPAPGGLGGLGFGQPAQPGQAPIPSRAARHQAKRQQRWRPSRGGGKAGPAGGVTPPAPWPDAAPPGDGFGQAPDGHGINDGTNGRSAQGTRLGRARGLAGESLRSARPAMPKIEVPTGLARTSLGLALILVVAAAGLGAVSSLVPRSKPPATPAVSPPYSARWVCPTLPKEASTVAVANVGGAAANLQTTVVRAGGGGAQPARQPLNAGTTKGFEVPASKRSGYVQVEAFNAPIAVSATGVPGCAPGPSDRWWIPAADTTLGATTNVVIANPDAEAAVVDLVPHVNQGSLQLAEQVFVPPRSAVTKQVTDERAVGLRPTIEVIARSGRVVAGAVVSQKDQRRVFLPGQSTAQAAWSFAGGLAGEGRRTDVIITNPSANPLSVDVQVSTDRGTFKPGNEFDKPVPAGAAVSIPVPPLRIGGAGAFAVRVRARDDTQFLAALRVSTPTSTGTTTYLDLGGGEGASSWLVPSVPASKQLVLANLGTSPLGARLGGPGGAGAAVRIDPGKVVVRQVPAKLQNVQVSAERASLLVAPLGAAGAVSGADIGGLDPGGPVVAGPAAG